MVKRDCEKMEKTVNQTREIFKQKDYEILMTKIEFEAFKAQNLHKLDSLNNQFIELLSHYCTK